MIRLTNINKVYLGEDLLKDITWHMKPGEKIGLIGPNGTGKTTQLRIICGQEEHDNGDVYIAPNTTIGYLSQEPTVNPDNTLDQELLSVFKKIIEIEATIRNLQKEIAQLKEGKELDLMLNEIAQLQEYFELKEGYAISAKIGQVISGLGFSEEDRNKLIKTFSGGWQMRISIAKLLLEAPDLLLLDEPTNHLDIKAIEWLENYLASYKGGFVIVSHDRQFLDKTVERIIEMEGARINLYWGNYTQYLQEKEVRYKTQMSSYKIQQDKIAKEKAFIERFRANAIRSSQAKSREKQLEKMNIISAPTKTKNVKFNFPVKVKSGDEVLKINQLYKAFGDNIIFEDVNLEVRLGEKIALIGDNGTGKTTLFKMILGLDNDYKGKIKHGYLVNCMYFSQHEARGLSGTKTAFEELHDSAPAYTNEQVRATLGRFGISGDNAFKTLDDLSGGEKARIALSKMLMAGANLLLFDEPTNHLDIPAKEALEEAINNFEGTVIVISHDRKFIDNFVSKIFIIENKSIKVHYGDYSDYKYKLNKLSQQEKTSANSQKAYNKKEITTRKTCTIVDNPKKLSPKAIEKQINKVEKEIIQIEEEIKIIEDKLANPDYFQNSPDEFIKSSEELNILKEKLNNYNDNWYELIEIQE
ncbi:MAG: ABC-F family ATP-binding cassette domain-containing protein [Cyanobacteriota bacterium]